ncbi:hypothetical protein N9N28_08630 [Rubripirellula amarantea]|nr:hypothetical protein [Rubripirellula amarantea]
MSSGTAERSLTDDMESEMRYTCFTLLSLAMGLTLVGGCRQTTGPTASGQLSPLGSLSPVAPGQTPVLGPFGGSTRVSPPPTGSFNGSATAVVPNNYLGSSPTSSPYIGSAPNGFSQYDGLATAPSELPPPSNDSFDRSPIGASTFDSTPIGSGVQTASWTETNAAFGPATTFPQQETPADRSQFTNQRDARAGGMQVIDLTGAPNPPGYTGVNSYAGSSVQYSPSPIASPSMMPSPANNYAGQSAPMRFAQTGFTPMPSTTPQFESRPRPFDSQANVSAFDSRGASMAEQAQTPAAPTTTGQNLDWRRPGTQY